MGVYIIAQLKFTSVERYRAYQREFPSVFSQFNGTAIVADEAPTVVEGNWPRDKVVILYFPTKEDAWEFQNSPDYVRIAEDRKAGADATVIIAQGANISASA